MTHVALRELPSFLFPTLYLVHCMARCAAALVPFFLFADRDALLP